MAIFYDVAEQMRNEAYSESNETNPVTYRN